MFVGELIEVVGMIAGVWIGIILDLGHRSPINRLGWYISRMKDIELRNYSARVFEKRRWTKV